MNDDRVWRHHDARGDVQPGFTPRVLQRGRVEERAESIAFQAVLVQREHDTRNAGRVFVYSSSRYTLRRKSVPGLGARLADAIQRVMCVSR